MAHLCVVSNHPDLLKVVAAVPDANGVVRAGGDDFVFVILQAQHRAKVARDRLLQLQIQQVPNLHSSKTDRAEEGGGRQGAGRRRRRNGKSSPVQA